MEFLNWNGPSFIPEMIVTPGKSWTGLHIWNYCKNNLKKSNCPRGNLNLLLGEFSCQTFFGIFYLELFYCAHQDNINCQPQNCQRVGYSEYIHYSKLLTHLYLIYFGQDFKSLRNWCPQKAPPRTTPTKFQHCGHFQYVYLEKSLVIEFNEI